MEYRMYGDGLGHNGTFEGYAGSQTTGTDALWQLSNGFLLLYMQGGFSMYEAGCVRAKNVKDILSRNLVDLAICTLVFWGVGWSFTFGSNEHFLSQLIGSGDFFIDSDDVPARWLYQMGFAANTVTLSSGMLAERSQYWCYLCTTLFLGGLIYPMAAHCVWSSQGWLYEGIGGLRFIDFAGSGVVHVIGGFYGFIGCILVGPRFGRFRSKQPLDLEAAVSATSEHPPEVMVGVSNAHSHHNGHRATPVVAVEEVSVALRDTKSGLSMVNQGRGGHNGAGVGGRPTGLPASNASLEEGDSQADQPSVSGADNGFPSGMPRFDHQGQDEVSYDPRSENLTEPSSQAAQSQPYYAAGDFQGASTGPVASHGTGASFAVEVGAAGSGNGLAISHPEADQSDEEDYIEEIPGHSTTEMIAGVFILWFGWYGFNVGSTQGLSSSILVRTASRVSLTMTLCPAASAITSTLYHRFIANTNTWCLDKMANAMLCGLVAVTAPCAVIDAWAGILLGICACITYEIASQSVLRARIDDPVDGFAVHGCGGMLGLVWCGLFAKKSHLESMDYNAAYPGLFMGGGFELLGVQIVGMLFLLGLAGCGACLVFYPLKVTGRLRVTLNDELMGLDIAKHGGPAYPEWHKIS